MLKAKMFKLKIEFQWQSLELSSNHIFLALCLGKGEICRLPEAVLIGQVHVLCSSVVFSELQKKERLTSIGMCRCFPVLKSKANMNSLIF